MDTAGDKKHDYQCVHCGNAVDELYKDFKKGIIKISHCSKCKNVVDKYIEYDAVIIFLDILLLQRPAYRHILVNSKMKGYWRLLLVLWLCDALTKLMQRKSAVSSPRLQPDHVFYSALEVDFYHDYLISAAESALFFCTVTGLLAGRYFIRQKNFKHFELESILRAVVVSSMGRLLIIPALIWGESYSVLGCSLTHLFVASSNVQALRVVSHKSGVWVVTAMVAVGYALQAAAIASLASPSADQPTSPLALAINASQWLHFS